MYHVVEGTLNIPKKKRKCIMNDKKQEHHSQRQIRESNGRFVTKRKLQWKANILEGIKIKKLRSESHKEKLPEQCNIEGRRIIEISELAKDLWCNLCNNALSLRYVEQETIIGAAYMFVVRCHNCLSLINVHSAKRNNNISPHFIYDVNRKLAIGCIDSGISTTKINTIFSAMNIPTVTSTLIKRHERAVGTAIESVAHQSCLESIQEEKDLIIKKNQ